MIQGLPDCKDVLVLAPHPDDEALGCAGTLSLLNRQGVSSTVVFISDGECLNGAPSATVAAARREEGKKCSEMLGCREPVFLGLPDGDVGSHIETGMTILSGIIGLKKPDIIFSPSPVDHHQDHIATARIAARLLQDAGTFRLAFYEVYSTVRFNYLIDITGAAEKKEQAILNYRTSLYGRPEKYVHASLGMNAHRSIFAEKEGYYEAFYIIERNDGLARIRDYLSYGDF